MTPRQKFFVLEYLLDLDPTEAAIRAGYRPTNARYQGQRLMHDPEIANEIRKAMAERARRCGITEERVLKEYARVAFADMRLIADWGPDGVWLKESSELDDDAAAAIALLAEVETQRYEGLRVKTFDKRKALEALARILGLNLVEPERRAAPHA